MGIDVLKQLFHWVLWRYRHLIINTAFSPSTTNYGCIDLSDCSGSSDVRGRRCRSVLAHVVSSVRSPVLAVASGGWVGVVASIVSAIVVGIATTEVWIVGHRMVVLETYISFCYYSQVRIVKEVVWSIQRITQRRHQYRPYLS